MPPQADPSMDAESALSQISASGMSRQEIEEGTMTSLQEADPQIVQEMMASLQGVVLPADVKEELIELVMDMLKSPQDYQELLQEAIDEGLPAEMFPPEYNIDVLSALRFVLSQVPTEEAEPEVQNFRDGGPVSLKPIAKFLQDQGRNGDTILAHINPEEAALLKSRGGAGTINPVTGLREYGLRSRLKKVGRSISKAVKRVGSAISSGLKKVGEAAKKFVKSDLGKAVLAVGAVMLAIPTGGASLGAAGGILSSIGSGLASIAMSPAGISAITTTGVQMARGKSFKEAAKDGLKVGAAIGIGTAFTGGSIGAGFGVGPGAVPIESFSGALDAAGRSVGQIQRMGQTVWDKVSSPFETVVNPKTGEKVLEVFGLPTKTIGDIASGVGTVASSVAAYKDAKAQNEANEQLAAQQAEAAKPMGPGQAFTIGGVQSPTEGVTPPPIDITNPIVAPGLGQPQEGPEFAIPESSYSGYNPYAFLSEEAQVPEEGMGGDQIFRFQPENLGPQNPFVQMSPEQFLAMYGPQQGPQGIATFAKGGSVASDPVSRARAALGLPPLPPSKKLSDPVAESIRQRDNTFLANQAAAQKAADQRKFLEEQKVLRQQADAREAAQKAQQESAMRARLSAQNSADIVAQQRQAQERQVAQAAAAQAAAAQKAEQDRQAARAIEERNAELARQAAIKRAAEQAAAARAARPPVPAPVQPPQGLQPGAQPQVPVQPAPAPVQPPAGGIATLPEAPVQPAPAPIEPAPAPVQPPAEGIATLPVAPTLPPPEAPINVSPAPVPPGVAPGLPGSPGGPIFETLPANPPQGPVTIQPYPMPGELIGQPSIPQIPTMPVYGPEFGVQPQPQIPENQFYMPIDFGNPGFVGFNTSAPVAPGNVPAFFNQGGIAAASPSRFSKGTPPKFYPRKVGAINGPGTGTSDSIPAMLSDGEFVFTAKAVRAAGGGSRIAGAKKMYQMMKALERKAQRG
jgi:hypothetical protein